MQNTVAEYLLRLHWFVVYLALGRGGFRTFLFRCLTALCGFKSIAGEIEFQDNAVMDESVDCCRCGHLVVKDLSPLGERVFSLAGRDPGLVYQPPIMVGAPDSGLVLHGFQGRD